MYSGNKGCETLESDQEQIFHLYDHCSGINSKAIALPVKDGCKMAAWSMQDGCIYVFI